MSSALKRGRKLNPSAVAMAQDSIRKKEESLKAKLKKGTITLGERRQLRKMIGFTAYAELCDSKERR